MDAKKPRTGPKKAKFNPQISACKKSGDVAKAIAFAEKRYEIVFDAEKPPATVDEVCEIVQIAVNKLAVIEHAASGNFDEARRYAAYLETQGVPSPVQMPDPEMQSKVAGVDAPEQQDGELTHPDGRPRDQYAAQGLGVKPLKKVKTVYAEDGQTPLHPDTHPVLPENEAFRDDSRYNQDNPEQDLFLAQGGQPSARTPHGPQNHKRFRHPQSTKFLFNPMTGVYHRPTELLMRSQKLQPVFQNPPQDAVIGS